MGARPPASRHRHQRSADADRQGADLRLPGRPGEPGSGFENRAEAYVGHPDDPGSWRQVDPPIDPRTGKPTDIWCGGTSLLADGRVLVTGDNLDEDPAHVSTGLNTGFTFDPWTESWQSHEPMRQGRWYPTQLLMPDGRTLIASGQSAPGDPDFGSLGPAGSRGMDDDAEVFEPGGDVSQLDFRSTSRAGRRSRRSTRGSFARIPGTCWLPARDRQLVPRSRQVVGVERAPRPLAHARLGHCGHARRRARADSLRRVPRFPSDDTRIDVLGYSFGGFIAR